MYCLPKKYVSYTKTASLVYERRKYQVSYTKRAFLVYGGGNPAASLPGRDIAVLFQDLHAFIDGEAPPAAGERDAAVVPAAYMGGLPGPPEGLVQ